MTSVKPGMRICLAINSLRPGGAERVAANLVNEWVRTGHTASVLTLESDSLDFYRLDPAVDRRALGLVRESGGPVRGLLANLSRLRRLREEFRAIRPDVIVSFIDQMNVLVLAAAAGLGIPVVVSERIDPRVSPLGGVWKGLRRLTYGRASGLVVQTESVAQWARGIVKSQRVEVIPNPVGESCITIGRRSRTDARARRVVAVGRLVPQKGFDTLIAAFDRATAGHPDWSLVIAGEGPLEADLRAQAGRCRAADRITLAGLVGNPEELLGESAIFVLSSRFEGFPNALVEGMACGCAVIATDCPSGPAEIITPGVDGLLVPVDDVAALSASIQALVANESERRRLGAASAASVERLRAHRIAEEWLGLFTSVSAEGRRRRLYPADGPQLASER